MKTLYEQKEIAEEFLELLKTANKLDPEGLDNLLEYRQPTTDAMRHHEHIVVCGAEGAPVVGVLGLINGFLSMTTHYRVGVVLDSTATDQEKFILLHESEISKH